MRKSTVVLLFAVAVAACDGDAISPAPALDQNLEEAAGFAIATSFVESAIGRLIPLVHRLPEDLELSSAQKAQIKQLLEQFAQAVKADREALAAIHKQARAAATAGKSRAEIRAILEAALPIRERLAEAERNLQAGILEVLTPEQKAWIESHQEACRAHRLTDEQKAEIAALVAAFEQANHADLEAIKTAHTDARAARQSGAARADVRAILESVKPAMERIRAARVQLESAIKAVLTPEQIGSGCHVLRGPRG
ncbi:MAG: Spy/CpxP family protein refolding chaperone [Gemmatimonadota bacterium]